MNALLDTDVVLDILLQRQPFVTDAAAIWLAHENGDFRAFISGITPVNVFYILRKATSIVTAQHAVRTLLDTVSICVIDAAVLQAACRSPIIDFEDAVQHESAVAGRLDAIVTRDLQHYRDASLPVYSPADFLRQLLPQE